MSPSNEFTFRVDKEAWEQLEKLCQDLTNTCGLVTAMLELALSKSQPEQLRCVEGAKRLSLRGMETLKRFLWRWAELRESQAAEEIPAPLDQETLRLLREAVCASKLLSGRSTQTAWSSNTFGTRTSKKHLSSAEGA